MEAIDGPIDVIATAKSLGLPREEYLVIGSGVMTALGIRQSADVDLIVSPRVFEELKSRGWKSETVEIEGRLREKVSQGAVVFPSCF